MRTKYRNNLHSYFFCIFLASIALFFIGRIPPPGFPRSCKTMPYQHIEISIYNNLKS